MLIIAIEILLIVKLKYEKKMLILTNQAWVGLACLAFGNLLIVLLTIKIQNQIYLKTNIYLYIDMYKHQG